MIMLIAFLAASVASIFAGFFGSGASLVLVPVLNHLLVTEQIPNAYNMQVSIGTALAFGFIMMLIATHAQHKKGAVIWPIFWRLFWPTVIGVILGSLLASQLSGKALHWIFGISLILLAAWSYVRRKKDNTHWSMDHWFFLFGAFLIAISVGLIGAGVLTIPFLRKYKVPLLNAIALTVALGIITAFFGTLSYILMGYGKPGLPSSCIGYVDWQLLLPLTVGSLLFSKQGVKLAHHVPHNILHYLFCVFLLGIGIKMLW